MNRCVSVYWAGNDFVIPLRGAQIEVSRVAFRIQEELVKPLRELDITDKEFACLKTIVFFAPGQSDQSMRGRLQTAAWPHPLHQTQNKLFWCSLLDLFVFLAFLRCSLVWAVWPQSLSGRVSNNIRMWWISWQSGRGGCLLNLMARLPEAVAAEARGTKAPVDWIIQLCHTEKILKYLYFITQTFSTILWESFNFTLTEKPQLYSFQLFSLSPVVDVCT